MNNKDLLQAIVTNAFKQDIWETLDTITCVSLRHQLDTINDELSVVIDAEQEISLIKIKAHISAVLEHYTGADFCAVYGSPLEEDTHG